MRIRFIGLVLGVAVVLGLGLLAAPPASANVAACPTVLPVLTPRPAGAPQSVQAQFAPGPGDTSYHLTDPCGGMFAMPPFQGVSPLSITSVPGMCNWGYGDIGVWQAGGHSYVVLSGFGLVMFHIFNVDDPYHPVALITQPFPANGTASTSVFPFQQNGHRYISVTMRGSRHRLWLVPLQRGRPGPPPVHEPAPTAPTGVPSTSISSRPTATATPTTPG